MSLCRLFMSFLFLISPLPFVSQLILSTNFDGFVVDTRSECSGDTEGTGQDMWNKERGSDRKVEVIACCEGLTKHA